MPLLDEFSLIYPDIILDVHLSDELTVMDRDDVDIAIRGGYAPNERVMAVKLMDNEFIAAASASYLAEHGTPCHPLELPQHKGLYYRAPTGAAPWISKIAGQWQTVSAKEVAISNAGTWLINKAIEGKGIVMLPRWVLAPYFKQHTLQELVFEPAVHINQTPEMSIFLLYQKQRYSVPKIKVAVDFLIDHIKKYSQSLS
jgi:DNA-binding transcriptional LysR family regulator